MNKLKLKFNILAQYKSENYQFLQLNPPFT